MIWEAPNPISVFKIKGSFTRSKGIKKYCLVKLQKDATGEGRLKYYNIQSVSLCISSDAIYM